MEKEGKPDITHQEKREPNVLPATEVTKNPNPRANENVPSGEMESGNQDTEGVGSEITDGEDA